MIVVGAIALVILVILITILVSSMRSQDEKRAGVYKTVDLIEWCKCARMVEPNSGNAKARCEPVESLVGEFGDGADTSISSYSDEVRGVEVGGTSSSDLKTSCGDLGG